MPAEVEIFETLAGIDSVRSSAQQAAVVYCAIMRPLSTPVSQARKEGKSLCGHRADNNHSSRRSAMPAMWQRAIRNSSIAIARGIPWKLPPERISLSDGKISGLSVTAPSSAEIVPVILAMDSIAAPRT